MKIVLKLFSNMEMVIFNNLLTKFMKKKEIYLRFETRYVNFTNIEIDGYYMEI
jgi:hypothetical protein